jgi:hypothetical protein
MKRPDLVIMGQDAAQHIRAAITSIVTDAGRWVIQRALIRGHPGDLTVPDVTPTDGMKAARDLAKCHPGRGQGLHLALPGMRGGSYGPGTRTAGPVRSCLRVRHSPPHGWCTCGLLTAPPTACLRPAGVAPV